MKNSKFKMQDDTIVIIDNLKFDLLGMRIFDKEEEIRCTAHEWIVLKLLLENPGEVVARSTIVDYVR